MDPAIRLNRMGFKRRHRQSLRGCGRSCLGVQIAPASPGNQVPPDHEQRSRVFNDDREWGYRSGGHEVKPIKALTP